MTLNRRLTSHATADYTTVASEQLTYCGEDPFPVFFPLHSLPLPFSPTTFPSPPILFSLSSPFLTSFFFPPFPMPSNTSLPTLQPFATCPFPFPSLPQPLHSKIETVVEASRFWPEQRRTTAGVRPHTRRSQRDGRTSNVWPCTRCDKDEQILYSIRPEVVSFERERRLYDTCRRQSCM